MKLATLIVVLFIYALSCHPLCAAKKSKKSELNPKVLKMEANKWLKLHALKKGDKDYFKRQEHGGSCFDSKRGLFVLFGSNTHAGGGGGRVEHGNTPRYFDPVKLLWTRDYESDVFSTYKANKDKVAVAGKNSDHPWAQHTFGAVIYDTKRDEMVVASSPGHLKPGRFTNVVKQVWRQAKTHPTWTLNLETKKWTYLKCKPISFFPNCTVYDSTRNIVIGHSGRGIYELSGEPRKWNKVVGGGQVGWHNNAAYDSKNKVLIGFGNKGNSNDILVYDPKKKTLVKMPTTGTRPAKDQHNPMAFEPDIGKTVILVDRDKKTTECWLYDYAKDSWEQVKEAGFDVALGMNYNLEYDPNHKVLFLVEGGLRRRATSVWALKLKQ